MIEYFKNLEELEFLRKYDHWLLVNHPRLWMIRLPYLVVYAVLANVLVFLFVLILPLKIHHIQEFFTILWVIFLMTLVAFYLWSRQFRRYSPEKAYENTSALQGLRDYLIIIACIIVLISPTITTAEILKFRFGGMITLEELSVDSTRVEGIEFGERYPVDLVLKYTGERQESRNDFGNFITSSAVERSINRFEGIKTGEFEELWSFSFAYIFIIHFGIILFAGKHVPRRIIPRTVIYAILLFLGYTFYAVMLSILAFSQSFLGQVVDRSGPGILGWPGPFILILVFTWIMALSVFIRKEYSRFTAMNIVLLPVVTYIFLAYLILDLGIENNFTIFDNARESYYFGMLIFSPLVYVWMIPILKMMYMRMLALPQK